MEHEVPGSAAQEPAENAGDAAPHQAVRTGVPSVDEVISAVEELEERPLEEHVGVFEAAHDQLRRALDVDETTGGETTGPRPPSA